ncbi:hypothetical protein [Halobacterium sp. KA-4]|uniref:hypothetical protein n=1 Tax=Halobacterium sp. KA-4 TaxID=2896367 RepID=UPI003FA53558
MGRILSEKTSQSPRFTGPAEKELIPDRLRIDGEIPTWSKATRRFRSLVQYLEEEDIKTYRVLDFETFTSDWAGAAWSDLYRVDQQACEWAQSTALISFSGSYWLDKSSQTFLPPVTYLARLQSSKRARQKSLSRALDDVDHWQAIRAIGGEGYNGYPRVFLGLYLSEPVQQSTLAPVLESHVNNCPIAKEDAHDPQVVVRIEHSPEHRSRLVHALGQKVPALSSQDAISVESWEKQKIATVLHGGGWRPYSFGESLK